MSVRVRYAPSPTGNQHIGGVRTALFNYFFARATGGKFILRIEDTDQVRFHEGALQDIYDTFNWLGITWDEGPDREGPHSPYFQSQRKEIYEKYAEKLVAEGKAYYCFCTAKRLEELREEQKKNKTDYGYDRHCRDLSPEEQARLREENPTPVIRLKIPLEGSTVIHDRLLGNIERANVDISPDPVLLKSDRFPTYHLANVIDDHLMEITHILRAQEWIPSGPIHKILYNAFGWEPPEYIHLPLVMGSGGQKLSKRHGDTSLIDFRNKGYLKEAIINYVTMLGWAYDDSREMFTTKELEELFSIDKINKAPAVFDYKKLEWFNGVYIRAKSDEELKELVMPFLIKDGLVAENPDQAIEALVLKMMPLVKERLNLLSEISDKVRFFFKEPGDYEPKALLPKKTDAVKTIEILETLKSLLEGFDSRGAGENEQLFRDKANAIEVKLGNFLMPLRVALTGSTVSPPLFESLELLGAEKSIQRIDRAIEKLKTLSE